MQDLPFDVMLMVVEYLSLDDLFSLMRTNLLFYEFCSSEEVWRISEKLDNDNIFQHYCEGRSKEKSGRVNKLFQFNCYRSLREIFERLH